MQQLIWILTPTPQLGTQVWIGIEMWSKSEKFTTIWGQMAHAWGHVAAYLHISLLRNHSNYNGRHHRFQTANPHLKPHFQSKIQGFYFSLFKKSYFKYSKNFKSCHCIFRKVRKFIHCKYDCIFSFSCMVHWKTITLIELSSEERDRKYME